MHPIKSVSQRIEERNNQHQSLDLAPLHASNAAFKVELRKKHRLSYLNAKRFRNEDCQAEEFSAEVRRSVDEVVARLDGGAQKIEWLMRMIEDSKNGLDTKCYCLVLCTSLVQSTENANIFVVSGYADAFIDWLKATDKRVLLKLTAMAINITSADRLYIEMLIEKGILLNLVELVKTHTGKIQSNCIWALNNICTDSNSARKALICMNFHEWLIFLIENSSERYGRLYALLGFLGKHITSEHVVSKFVCIFVDCVNENLFLEEALWGIYIITYYDPDRIELLLSYKNLLKSVLFLALDPLKPISIVSLKIIGSISSSTTGHTQRLLDAGVLDILFHLIESTWSEIRKEAYFALSNIAAGVADQLRLLFSREELLKKGFQGIIDQAEDVRAEAWHVLLNVSMFKNKDFVLKLADLGVLEFVKSAFGLENNPKCMRFNLEFCEHTLNAGKVQGQNTVVPQFYEIGLFSTICSLQDHSNKDISMISDRIIQDFYEFSEETE